MSNSWLQRLQMPHVFILITGVIFVCALATWVIPSGSFERETKEINGSNRTVVVPGSYEPVEKHRTAQGVLLNQDAGEKAAPTSLIGFLSAVPRGMQEAADIIFFIFIIGGAFGILERTGVITATIQLLLDFLQNYAALLTAVIMVSIGLCGSFLGMGEEFIPLIPVFVVLAQKLGYDRIYGMAMVILAAQVGFASAITNPFTLGVAQGIAEVDYVSGWELRLGLFVCSITLTVGYLLWYGNRIKKDPSKSLLADLDDDDGFAPSEKIPTFNKRHLIILITSIGIFIGVIMATLELHWWFNEMSGGFFLMGIIAAIVGGLTLKESADAFVQGCTNMVVAALVVGFAKGIEVVLSEAMVLDTLIQSATAVLDDVPSYIAVQGMLAFQTLLNFFIPSGSGQAAVTMPIMAPIADVLGISRQTAILAFQCGDGYSNLIIPTSGILMSMLALARIPYQRWLRFMLPLLGGLLLLSMVFLTIAVLIGYN